MKLLHPEGWPKPKGYAHGTESAGRCVFVSGQIGWSEEETLVADDFVAQAAQALSNILAIVSEAGGAAQHIARMTWYVTDKKEYLASAKALGAAYRSLLGSHYPAMTLVEVADLLEPGAKVEIEATAVIP